MRSTDGVQDNIEKIAALFPECVTERENGVNCGIDFEMLRQLLSKDIIDEKEERYSFTWPDKRKAIWKANVPIAAALRPVREDSVDFDNTKNLYIEGDNLDVLKLLKETYLHKVKMIYIDPPYNTGNDFVYSDDFSQSIEDYKSVSGQYDEQGNRLFANTESRGRFHTDWLNMIYPRLKVARDLLSDDGVIFISIDDNEVANLKKICDEVFGEGNFICNFVRKNKSGSGHDSINVAIEFDYVLCYAKNLTVTILDQESVDIIQDNKYKYEDRHIARRGKYYLRDLDYRGSYSEGLDYPITAPDGSILYSGNGFGRPNTWRWSRQKFEWGLEHEYIVFKKKEEGWKVYIKQYQFVDNDDKLYKRKIPYRALIDFSNGEGSLECKKLLGTNIFSFPKSANLIKYFIKIAAFDKNSIILDFFSGSATTAHAVMQLNAEDGGQRRYICVQLPEKTAEDSEARKAGYKTICEIAKERIRRAGAKIKEESPLTTKDLDTGFRVLKLDSSNMQDVYYSPAETEQGDLFSLVDNVKDDRTGEDLLFQVMLELGATLDSKIERQEVAGKTLWNVAEGYLIACFDKDVTDEVVTTVAKQQPQYAVLRDSSIGDDQTASNFEQIFKIYAPNTITKIL